MATSGTYSFNPQAGSMMSYSYSLCGIRRAELQVQHLSDAQFAMNLILGQWGNSTPNLWKVDLIEVVLVPGQATYSVDPSTIMVLDAYIHTGSGDDAADRIIWPISRTEYASTPNKQMQAPPTVYWFDRLLAPTITLWQVPDDQQVYTLCYYRCIAVQDVAVANGQTIDLPPLWMNAMAWSLGAQLAASYASDRYDRLQGRADALVKEARTQNVENVPLYVMPSLGGYYPR